MERDLLKSLEPNDPDVRRKTGWIASMLEDCEREGVVLHRSTIIRNREFIFKLSENLGYSQLGIPGHTCRILEQYLCYIIDSGKRMENAELRKQHYHQKVMSRILLITVCSMQLASKMALDSRGLRVSLSRAILMRHKFYYTTEQIKETEMEIFAALGFYVPKWNSVDMTGILTGEVSEDIDDFKAAFYLMQLTEFNRNNIEMNLFSIAEFETVINNTRIRTLHLAAGCVAAAFKMNKRERDPIPILEKIVLVPSLYIQCIRDVVLKAAILHYQFMEEYNNCRKRKSDTDEEASTSKKRRLV